jgi:proline iminopeptidase
VAQYFALTQPPGLNKLVLSGPLSDAQLYAEAQWDPVEGSLGSLPPFVKARLHSLEAAGAYSSEEYETIASTLTTFFTLRTAPAPDCFVNTFTAMNKDIYVGMQGASEFTIGGVLATFNITQDLPNIRRPTLLTSGLYDTMRPPLLRTMLAGLPDAIWHVFPHSGHVSMIDDAGEMNDVVAAFLEGRAIPTQEAETFAPASTGLMAGIAVVAALTGCTMMFLATKLTTRFYGTPQDAHEALDSE